MRLRQGEDNFSCGAMVFLVLKRGFVVGNTLIFSTHRLNILLLLKIYCFLLEIY